MSDPDDHADITRRVYEYAYGIDTRDWDLYRSIFTHEITVDFSSYTGTGGPIIMPADDWVAGIQPLFTGLDATQHSMSNPLVERDGDDARCRMYMQATHFLTEDPDPRFTIGGCYDDQLVRVDDRWRISAVTLTVWWRQGNFAIMAAAQRRGEQIIAG